MRQFSNKTQKFQLNLDIKIGDLIIGPSCNVSGSCYAQAYINDPLERAQTKDSQINIVEKFAFPLISRNNTCGLRGIITSLFTRQRYVVSNLVFICGAFTPLKIRDNTSLLKFKFDVSALYKCWDILIFIGLDN